MSHTPHEIGEEFPEKVDLIHALRESDSHFARLAEEYHQLNRRVHRAETNVEPISNMAEIDMRKQRARLKDEIWGYLRDAAE